MKGGNSEILLLVSRKETRKVVKKIPTMESLHYFLLCSKTTITVDASEKFLDMNQKNALTPYIKSNLLTFDLYPNFKSVKLTQRED